MTAAVAIAHDGDVVVGIDSSTSDGDHLFDVTSKGPHTFPIEGHPALVVASAGRCSLSTELAYGWVPPSPSGADPLRFLAACAASLRAHFTTEPLWSLTKDQDGDLDGHFLAAWRGVAVEFGGDFGMVHPRNGEVTIGSGRALMLGALAATKELPPLERVHIALSAAAEYADSVLPPFTIVRAGR